MDHVLRVQPGGQPGEKSDEGERAPEYSRAALGDPDRWPGDSLPDAQAVDIDRAIEGAGGPDDELFEAAEAVMCDKWGSFAGEFEVEGRLLVDVESGRIVRRDSISVEGDPAQTEVETI